MFLKLGTNNGKLTLSWRYCFTLCHEYIAFYCEINVYFTPTLYKCPLFIQTSTRKHLRAPSERKKPSSRSGLTTFWRRCRHRSRTFPLETVLCLTATVALPVSSAVFCNCLINKTHVGHSSRSDLVQGHNCLAAGAFKQH